MLKFFKPGPGRFGTHPAFAQGALSGNLTANATNTIGLKMPYRKSYLDTLSVGCVVAPADADGTFLCTFKRKDNTGNAVVTLTAATNLVTAGLAAQKVIQIPLLASLTEAQKTLRPGDTLYVEIVNNSAAIDTQPTYLTFSAELLVLN